MKRVGLLIGMLVVGLIACDANADGSSRGYPYTVTLENDNGETLRTFYHHNQVFVLGQYGQRYNVRIQNHTNRRVEAVVSVDGRDAVSGDIGDYVRQRGYVLAPYGSVVVEGFRQSLDHVAAFRFTDPGNSYSSRRGTPENVGVIGVAFFPEREYRPVPLARPSVPPVSMPEYSRDMRANEGARRQRSEAPAASAGRADGAGSYAPEQEYREEPMARRQNNLGTEYGETRYSSVHEVTFVRANPTHPARILAVRYDDAEGLASRGIHVYDYYYSRPEPMPYGPQPFPTNRFAPPPY